MNDRVMTTPSLQAKVSLRGAWFAAHPNQPMPEGRAEVERLFAAIEAEARAPLDVDAAARALRERLTIDPGNVVSWGEWDTLDEALAELGAAAMTTPPRTPTPLDEAWEALEAEIHGIKDDFIRDAIARHRPLIEAEARASLDVGRLARALHRSYDRDPAVRRIEWSDLNEADRGMWRRHAATVAREYEAQP